MDKFNMFHFEKLEIYQLAKEIVKDCYSIVQKFPHEEKYALVPQVYRAAISVPSNIAEGVSRKGKKDQIHFLNISYASLMELVCQMQISQEVGYIDIENLKIFKQKANNLAVKMNNYSNYVKKCLND
jgi:four helix bundle protein